MDDFWASPQQLCAFAISQGLRNDRLCRDIQRLLDELVQLICDPRRPCCDLQSAWVISWGLCARTNERTPRNGVRRFNGRTLSPGGDGGRLGIYSCILANLATDGMEPFREKRPQRRCASSSTGRLSPLGLMKFNRSFCSGARNSPPTASAVETAAAKNEHEDDDDQKA